MLDTIEVKIKYQVPGLHEVEPANPGEWVDLRCAEDVFIPEHSYALISLGVSIDMPEGYEAIIIPRSSTYTRYGIIQANGCGLIDNTYRGDNDIWRFPCFCLTGREESYTLSDHGIEKAVRGSWVRKNDRICQFRVQKQQPKIQFVKVEKMGNPDRGGLGSTGRN